MSVIGHAAFGVECCTHRADGDLRVPSVTQARRRGWNFAATPNSIRSIFLRIKGHP